MLMRVMRVGNMRMRVRYGFMLMPMTMQPCRLFGKAEVNPDKHRRAVAHGPVPAPKCLINGAESPNGTMAVNAQGGAVQGRVVPHDRFVRLGKRHFAPIAL
jgi:hypothetical protein